MKWLRPAAQAAAALGRKHQGVATIQKHKQQQKDLRLVELQAQQEAWQDTSKYLQHIGFVAPQQNEQAWMDVESQYVGACYQAALIGVGVC